MSFQAGLFHFDRRPIDSRLAKTMLASLVVPEYGTPTAWHGPDVVMGYSDFASAITRQPCTIDVGTIVFDGRLDNRDDLIVLLSRRLHGNATDAELALMSYSTWGTAAFARLVGDWSLAIWDAHRQQVILASDYAGTRPLYYHHTDLCLRWSTRLATLVTMPDVSISDVDEQYVAGFLLHGACPHRTPYRGIDSVPPGSCVTVSRQGIEVAGFWQVPIGDTTRFRREADYEERLRELFHNSVRQRLRGKSPVLAELSGGLDSSSIVCMGSRLTDSQLVTVTYDRRDSVDAPFWRDVEHWCDTTSIHLPTEQHPFLTASETGITVPAFWQQLHKALSLHARGLGAHTLMTGILGDLVMGNAWDDSVQVAGLLREKRFASALRQALAWSKVVRVPVGSIMWQNIKRLATNRDTLPAGTFDDSITPSFRKRMELNDPRRFFSGRWAEAPVERRDLYRGVIEALELRKLQAPEALDHLNYTHPFMDRTLLSFLLSIPPDVLCRPGQRRRLMRRAFAELWPPSLLNRESKDSFGRVFYEGLRPLASSLLVRLEDSILVRQGFIEPAGFRVRLQKCVHGLECNQPQLRLVILLELWLQARIGVKSATY